MKATVACVVLLLCGLVDAAPADAARAPPPLEGYARADASVGLCRATAVEGALDVDRVIVGPPIESISLARFTPSRWTGHQRTFPAGTTVLALYDAQGDLVWAFDPQTHDAPITTPDEHVRALGAYLRARTDARRAAVLVREIARGTRYAESATLHLLEHVRWLSTLTPQMRRSLLRQARTRDDENLMLAAGITEVMPYWIDQLEANRRSGDALEAMTLHRMEARSPDERARGWRAWWAAHRREPRTEWLRARYAELGVTLDPDDRASLAAAMGVGEPRDRQALAQRCAFLGAPIRLGPSAPSIDEATWSRFARVCSDG